MDETLLTRMQLREIDEDNRHSMPGIKTTDEEKSAYMPIVQPILLTH